MKVIAYYLPQFHEIPENNEWWGEGFTEWVNVKKACPLYVGHEQPRVPVNNNYYDLQDSTEMVSQAELAKAYGVDGFCFYHYWFNGKQLLQKPLLSMLDNQDIDITFCLSWANEPWARTWDGKNKDVLMPQSYGDKKDWKDHFDYLLQYFQDDRYIKVDDKPMFVIYKTKDISNVEEMLSFWDELAIKNGFTNGLHIVETLGGKQPKPIVNSSSAVVEFEPSLSLGSDSNFAYWIKNKFKMMFNRGLYRIDYNDIVSSSTRRKIDYGKTKYLGCFPDWDNTPRKGSKGVVFDKSNPDNFSLYLERQLSKCDVNSFLFINAWNEWAEGAYLEPDQRYGFKYLESIRDTRKKLGL